MGNPSVLSYCGSSWQQQQCHNSLSQLWCTEGTQASDAHTTHQHCRTSSYLVYTRQEVLAVCTRFCPPWERTAGCLRMAAPTVALQFKSSRQQGGRDPRACLQDYIAHFDVCPCNPHQATCGAIHEIRRRASVQQAAWCSARRVQEAGTTCACTCCLHMHAHAHTQM